MKHLKELLLLAVLGLLGVIGVLTFKLQEERWKTHIFKEDQAFVRLAYLAEAEGSVSKVQRRHLMEPFYPLVMRFPNEVCVQLNSRMGWTDGGSIYCFDATDRHITRSFPVRP